MDSIRVSEAPDPSSILGEATSVILENNILKADFNSRLFLLLQNQHDILPDLVRTGGIHSTRSVWS